MDDYARLQWQCRRGMLELDLLLKSYLEYRYPIAGQAERQRFADLLKLEDDELLVAMMAGWVSEAIE